MCFQYLFCKTASFLSLVFVPYHWNTYIKYFSLTVVPKSVFKQPKRSKEWNRNTVVQNQGHTAGKRAQHYWTEMVDHLDHSSNRNGGSSKVQPRFKCMKIAFDYSGLASIFEVTHCRDSQNPEHAVYQLSVIRKHDVIPRQRNAERNWYVTRSYQNYFKANCVLWLP